MTSLQEPGQEAPMILVQYLHVLHFNWALPTFYERDMYTHMQTPVYTFRLIYIYTFMYIYFPYLCTYIYRDTHNTYVVMY